MNHNNEGTSQSEFEAKIHICDTVHIAAHKTLQVLLNMDKTVLCFEAYLKIIKLLMFIGPCVILIVE